MLRKLITIFIAILLSALVSSAAMAVQEEPEVPEGGVVNTQVRAPLNLRAGPGTNFAVLDTTPPVAGLALYGRNADGTWALTEFEDQVGWVDTTFVTADLNEIMQLPLATVPSRIIEDVAATTIVNLNQRTGPGTEFTIMTTIPEGTTVPVLGTNESRSWLRVEYQGEPGWVSDDFVDLSGDIEDVEVMTEADLEETVEELVEEPELPEDGVVNTQVRARLNVRAGPGTTYPVLTTTHQNAGLSLFARNEDGTWALTEFEGQRGWVDTTFVTADLNEIMQLPLAEELTPDEMPAEGVQANVVEASLTEFDIEMPTSIAAGQTTFEVTNNGTVEHNFEIEGQGIEQVFDSNLTPGETRTMMADLEPGTYTVYCPVANHRALGMEAELTVGES